MEDPFSFSLFSPNLLSIQFTTNDWLILGLLALVMLILLVSSALISASEIAFFSLEPHQIVKIKEKNKKGNLIERLLKKPEKLLATILIANNSVNIGLVILSTIFMDKIRVIGGPQFVYVIIQIVVVTALILLFGEVVPKVYATQKGERLALFMAVPLNVLNKTFSGLSIALVRLSKVFDKGKTRRKSLSVDELSEVHEIVDDEHASEHEQKMLEGVLEFGTTEVTQIMRSRMDISAISLEDDYENVKKVILDSGYSRIPVFEESIDKIKGILYIKDLLPHLNEDNEFHWQQLIRTPFFVPENKKLDDLLREFQEKKVHLAVVIDEFGGTEGIITLEDVIEEIVGDIRDEFDDEELDYSIVDDDTFIFNAKTPLLDMFRIIDFDSDDLEEVKGDSDTIAGLILEKTGTFPKAGEVISIKNLHFTIESVDKKRIKKVKLEVHEVEA